MSITMQSQRPVLELDVHVTVRGDVATICAFVLKPHFDLNGVNVLEQEIAGLVNRRQDWSIDAYYRLGDQVFIHAQNLPPVLKHLRARGHSIDLSEYKDWSQLSGATQANSVLGLAPWGASALHAVCGQPWGQILAARGMAPGIVAALVKFYSDANVLVVVKNAESVKHIYRELRLRTNRCISSGIEIPRSVEPLVHIDSLAGLSRSSHDWPVLIFADVESARSDTGMQQAVSMPGSVIYAIIPVDQRLDEEDRLRLRITCGPVLFRLPGDSLADTDVTVLSVRAKGTRLPLPRNGLNRKRQEIWHQVKRNQQTAMWAEAFVSANLDRIGGCGIAVDAIQQQLQDIGQHPRVAIIVECPEHARELRRMLPGWRVAAGARLADKHLPTFPLDCPRVIITRARAKAAGLAADVVILADGTGQAWSDDYGPDPYFDRRSMIVVDLFDTFDARVLDCKRSRLADYRARRWNVIETSQHSAAASSAR
jgi:hypothetical protein